MGAFPWQKRRQPVEPENVEDDGDETGEGGEVFDPAAHNIADVLAYVGDDAGRAAGVLALETARENPRTSLVSKLEAITAPAE